MQVGISVALAIAVIVIFFIFNPFTAMQQNAPANLVVQDEAVGTGKTASSGDLLTVNYTGKLENGTVFDTSVGKAPFQFILGAGRVIPGWEQGLQGMKEGGKRILIIPPNLAYGPNNYGPIPGNSTLTFEIELIKVATSTAAPAAR